MPTPTETPTSHAPAIKAKLNSSSPCGPRANNPLRKCLKLTLAKIITLSVLDHEQGQVSRSKTLKPIVVHWVSRIPTLSLVWICVINLMKNVSVREDTLRALYAGDGSCDFLCCLAKKRNDRMNWMLQRHLRGSKRNRNGKKSGDQCFLMFSQCREVSTWRRKALEDPLGTFFGMELLDWTKREGKTFQNASES